jgi:hypothetical protein
VRTKSLLTEAERADLLLEAGHPDALYAAVEEILKARLRAIEAPLQSAKDLTDAAVGHGKDRDDCTPAEMRARGVWHALHYVERRLTGWDDLPEDLHADAVSWEKVTEDFERLARSLA